MKTPNRILAARSALALFLALGLAAATWAQATVQFAFVSDLHYGITRKTFDGANGVDAKVVNANLVAKLNSLPALTFANDGGVNAGNDLGSVDFIAIGGDISNREEGTKDKAIQSAAASWAQFKADYLDNLMLRRADGSYTPLYIVPGNHDVSNAVGYYKDMYPATDATAYTEIYNLAMKPQAPLAPAAFSYAKNRVNYSVDIGGIHFAFITMWPDSVERAWLDADLKKVAATTPVILFAHDEPAVESKHFTNPNGTFDINKNDKFENLLADKLADGKKTINDPSTIEQLAFETWLKSHPNVTAYFHGNTNFNQFYDYTGADGAIALHTFRVDSPMKGETTASDETKLSFQVVSINTASRTMTVREALWNTDPTRADESVVWGASTTVALMPRPPIK